MNGPRNGLCRRTAEAKPKTKTAPFRHSQTSDVGFDSHRPLQIVTPSFAVSLPRRSAFLQIVSSIAAGADPDVTGGAHYYLNPKSIGIFRRELRKKGPCHYTPQ
jgi:hypothetical protein